MNALIQTLLKFLRDLPTWHELSHRHEPNPLLEAWLAAHKDSKAKEIEKSSTSAELPVEGAVDYREMKWDSYTRAVESLEQFTFYVCGSLVKAIPKENFSHHREIAALRRVIRRNVPDNELLDD